jgi:hypothetical protein
MMAAVIVMVATRFGTFSRTSDFSVFGTAIVFLGAATRGGLKYWYYEVCFLSSFGPFSTAQKICNLPGVVI